MILASIPYFPNDLGQAYNDTMRLVDDGDWVCFLDHDAMFTTPDWHSQLTEIVAKTENLGLLTCMTNRIGNPEQRIFQPDSSDAQRHDMRDHRGIGADIAMRDGVSVRDAVAPISGVMLMTSKAAWKRSGGFRHGILGVDRSYHRRVLKAGLRVCIADGVYVYHWYRHDERGNP